MDRYPRILVRMNGQGTQYSRHSCLEDAPLWACRGPSDYPPYEDLARGYLGPMQVTRLTEKRRAALPGYERRLVGNAAWTEFATITGSHSASAVRLQPAAHYAADRPLSC